MAENSFIDVFAFIVTVAAMHYVLWKVDGQIPALSEATKGAQLLAKIVSEANENDEVCPVMPANISTSTDDQTMYVFDGRATIPKLAVTPEEKKLHMAGYLCKLGYDLVISPHNHVSRSAGFESYSSN
jgi:hypothetical protein